MTINLRISLMTFTKDIFFYPSMDTIFLPIYTLQHIYTVRVIAHKTCGKFSDCLANCKICARAFDIVYYKKNYSGVACVYHQMKASNTVRNAE